MSTKGLRVDTSRNESIDNRVTETCAYEIDHISLLWDSTMSSALSFCFYLFYCNGKKEIILDEKINSKKMDIYLWNQYYYYFDLPKIRVGRARITKN